MNRSSITVLTALMLGFNCCSIASAATVRVSDAWSRPAMTTGVVYATLNNTSTVSDAFDKVTTSVAQRADLHVSTTQTMPMHSDNAMDAMMASGVMSMHEVQTIRVPTKGTAVLKPGSYHVMLSGLYHPLHLGQHFAVHLHFVHAGWITTTAVVR